MLSKYLSNEWRQNSPINYTVWGKKVEEYAKAPSFSSRKRKGSFFECLQSLWKQYWYHKRHQRRCNIIEALYFPGKKRTRIPWSDVQAARDYASAKAEESRQWKRTFNYHQAHRVVIFIPLRGTQRRSKIGNGEQRDFSFTCQYLGWRHKRQEHFLFIQYIYYGLNTPKNRVPCNKTLATVRSKFTCAL